MSLFRRKGKDSAPSAEAIPRFWTWWSAEGATQCAGALAAGSPESLADPLSSRIAAIHSELAWELAAGDVSEHRLVVSAEGNPALRALARRWLLAAPPADPTWSYDDHRGPVEDPEGIVLDAPGAPAIPFSGILVGARLAGNAVDVTVHHPAFADLDEGSRLQVSFLALDAALGEDNTEVWVGQITPGEHPPLDGFGLVALRALVDQLRRKHVDEDGRPQWALLQGEGPRGPVLATARSPLHPLFGPLFTRHVAAEVPYAERTEAGLPGRGSLDALNALEDRLEDAVGADGLLAAHESTDGVRLFHVYVDPETDAADRVRAAFAGWAEGRVRVQVRDGDAGWEAVRHLR